MPYTLTKQERLCGKTAISALMEKGRWGSYGCIRYCVLAPGGAEVSRIMVSVPKKNFKRAVKRNLLKRRIRESYRMRKEMLAGGPVDVLFYYNTKEVLSTAEIGAVIEGVLGAIARKQC